MDDKSTLEKVGETIKKAAEAIIAPAEDLPVQMPLNESRAEIRRAATPRKRAIGRSARPTAGKRKVRAVRSPPRKRAVKKSKAPRKSAVRKKAKKRTRR